MKAKAKQGRFRKGEQVLWTGPKNPMVVTIVSFVMALPGPCITYYVYDIKLAKGRYSRADEDELVPIDAQAMAGMMARP